MLLLFTFLFVIWVLTDIGANEYFVLFIGLIFFVLFMFN